MSGSPENVAKPKRMITTAPRADSQRGFFQKSWGSTTSEIREVKKFFSGAVCGAWKISVNEIFDIRG